MRWQLQEAKARLSEVLARARSEGPQVITLRGEEAAVLLSFEDFRRLASPGPLVSTLRESPLRYDEPDLVDRLFERSRDMGRPPGEGDR
jgi:prevent-host-death family protein